MYRRPLSPTGALLMAPDFGEDQTGSIALT